jgi:uncharacterized membrane protein
MKKTILITISILSVALIGLAFARGHGWRPCAEERVAHITSEIAERLDLSAAQKMTLDGIAEDFLEERQQVMKDRRAFKSSLMEMLSQESLTAQELTGLFETKKPAIETVLQTAAEHLAEFHGMLTPEQRRILVAEMESYDGRRCRFLH